MKNLLTYAVYPIVLSFIMLSSCGDPIDAQPAEYTIQFSVPDDSQSRTSHSANKGGENANRNFDIDNVQFKLGEIVIETTSENGRNQTIRLNAQESLISIEPGSSQSIISLNLPPAIYTDINVIINFENDASQPAIAVNGSVMIQQVGPPQNAPFKFELSANERVQAPVNQNGSLVVQKADNGIIDIQIDVASWFDTIGPNTWNTAIGNIPNNESTLIISNILNDDLFNTILSRISPSFSAKVNP